MKKFQMKRGDIRCLDLEPIIANSDVDSIVAFAKECNNSTKTIYNWLKLGISWQLADDLCVLIAKKHPVEVFGGPTWDATQDTIDPEFLEDDDYSDLVFAPSTITTSDFALAG